MNNIWTTEQLLTIILPERERIDRETRHPVIGREKYFEAGGYYLRTLGYNLDADGELPLFINLHGAGFALGHAEMDDPFLMNVAIHAGIRILNFDYSLTPESPFPTQIDECSAFIKHIRANAKKHGVDPQKIALGGHSAGATIAAATVLRDGAELNLRCLILDYPLLDLYTDSPESLPPFGTAKPEMSKLFRVCYHSDKATRKDPIVSPFFASDAELQKFPPTLITTCTPDDKLEAEALIFLERLRCLGVDTAYRQFIAPHAFNTHPGELTNESWTFMANYLKTQLTRF